MLKLCKKTNVTILLQYLSGSSRGCGSSVEKFKFERRTNTTSSGFCKAVQCFSQQGWTLIAIIQFPVGFPETLFFFLRVPTPDCLTHLTLFLTLVFHQPSFCPSALRLSFFSGVYVFFLAASILTSDVRYFSACPLYVETTQPYRSVWLDNFSIHISANIHLASSLLNPHCLHIILWIRFQWGPGYSLFFLLLNINPDTRFTLIPIFAPASQILPVLYIMMSLFWFWSSFLPNRICPESFCPFTFPAPLSGTFLPLQTSDWAPQL